MTTITIQISGAAAEKLRHLVEVEHRSEVETVGDALEAYAPTKPRLPKGVGKYRSPVLTLLRERKKIPARL